VLERARRATISQWSAASTRLIADCEAATPGAIEDGRI
jgi:hypothetical protein